MQQIVSRFGKVAGNSLAKIRQRVASSVQKAAHVLQHAHPVFDNLIMGNAPGSSGAERPALQHAHPEFSRFMAGHPRISRFLAEHPKLTHCALHAAHHIPVLDHYVDLNVHVPIALHIAPVYNRRARMVPRPPAPGR